MTAGRPVTVFGAYGHTGRFVVSELRARGAEAILSGRDADKLTALGAAFPGFETRLASVDDPASLDRALLGASAVINCAGPFAETSRPVIEAALRTRIPYLDIAAEIEVVAETFELYSGVARDAGIVAVPGMSFFGGLGDLLATVAMGDWPAADEISIAYGLDSWLPTAGTTATGRVSQRRRDGRRLVYTNHRMEFRTDGRPIAEWRFPPPLGAQTVVGEFTTVDAVTISRHLETPEIRSYMTRVAVENLSSPDSPSPTAADESGRSSQTFVVDVRARRGGEERRAAAAGRDIYAITAPLVVEAAARVVGGLVGKSGTFAAGEVFAARDFLESLCPAHLSLEIP